MNKENDVLLAYLRDWKYEVLSKMLKILPIALAHVKVGNTSENLLNNNTQTNLCIEQNKLLKRYITIKRIQTK